MTNKEYYTELLKISITLDAFNQSLSDEIRWWNHKSLSIKTWKERDDSLFFIACSKLTATQYDERRSELVT